MNITCIILMRKCEIPMYKISDVFPLLKYCESNQSRNRKRIESNQMIVFLTMSNRVRPNEEFFVTGPNRIELKSKFSNFFWVFAMDVVESKWIEWRFFWRRSNRTESNWHAVESQSNRIKIFFSEVESNPNGDFLIRFGRWTKVEKA